MRNITKLEMACAAGIIIFFFFLPWAQFMGMSASGYNLGEFGSYANLVWLIPGFSVLLIYLGVAGKNLKLIGVITGLLPFLGFLYALTELGGDIFHVLGIGAYLTMLSALILILASLGVLKTSEAPVEDGNPDLWGDIAKSMKSGVDTIVGKTGALSKIGKIKIDVLNINRKIEKHLARLGSHIYQYISEDKKTEIAKDVKILEIFDEIRALQENLQLKKQELEQAQMTGEKTNE